MIPSRARLAVLAAFLGHGLFILTARYRSSYDAYTHMLFADHYARNWFSLWETRWYAGFTVVSYPPLAHQLVALFVPLIGFDAAFAVILWGVMTAYPLGIYAFSRIFVGKTAASYAALAGALLLPLYVSAYLFGQLPFLMSTLIALFGAAALARYLHQGTLATVALAVSLAATSMAAHHATLLVQPFLVIAIVVAQLRRQNWQVVLLRLTSFGVLAIVAAFVVIWPFWQWALAQSMQTTIDHLSRHNYLTDLSAQATFFWPMYGPLIAVVPFVFYKWPRRFLGLTFSFGILFLLGLGGTTPLPRLLFGAGWEWLTYDRFSLWASLLLLPFGGALFILARRNWTQGFAPRSFSAAGRRRAAGLVCFSSLALTAFSAWLAPLFFQMQPRALNMQPILDFLNQDDRSQWRYLTFGFGNQYTYLNLLTQATTIDGSYHTARTLPELRSSGIGEIDAALWQHGGLAALDPILQAASADGVRWGFVNHVQYIPVLERNGWLYRWTLSDGVGVWENPAAMLPTASPPPLAEPLAAFSWGVLPLLTLICTVALGSLVLWPARAERIVRGLHAFLVGLIPLGLCFWYYRILWESPHARVYFTYDTALFFLCDAPALIAVLLWLAARLTQPAAVSWKSLLQRRSLLSLTGLLFGLCTLATLSILWSVDWRTSLYVAADCWLVFGLYLSLQDWQAAWGPAMLGLTAALSVQLVAGFVGFLTQSTAFLAPLKMNWPGALDVTVAGASVLQLPAGGLLLRAYGTLPHPNILAGFVLVFLLGPSALFLRAHRPNLAAPVLIGAGTVLLALTYSRSAWLGLAAAVLWLAWRSRSFVQGRLIALVLIMAVAFALALLPAGRLALGRLVPSPAARLEDISLTARLWLAGQSLSMLLQHPLTGVGIGANTIQLSYAAGFGYIIEPVHNMLMLAGSELGLPALLLVLGIGVTAARQMIHAKRGEAVLAGAVLAGLAVIGLFDHYLWTLGPGRMTMGLVLGLWAGQLERNAA